MLLDFDKNVRDYLTFVETQSIEVLREPPTMFAFVEHVDELIRSVWKHGIDLAPVPAFLGLNSYFSFLAAVRLATCGHVHAVFSVLRTGLESAIYSFAMSRDEDKISIWINRDTDDVARRKCRAAFGPVKHVLKELMAEDPDGGEYVDSLYEQAIDHGAHPNPAGLFNHVKPREDDGGSHWKFDLTCAYGAGTFEVEHALLVCGEYGTGIALLNAKSLNSHLDAESLTQRFQQAHDLKNKLVEKIQSNDLE